MKNAAKWNDKVVVDVQKYYKGKDVFKIVNTSKLISPLIVIDPVQKDRNAAAALSDEKFNAFKKAAKGFIKHPSKEFFAKKELSSIFLKEKKNNKMLKTAAKPLSGKADVVGSKLLKIFEFFNQQLERNDFKIIKSGWEWKNGNDSIFYFLFGNKSLPKVVEIEGPPLSMKEHVENFKKRHKKNYSRNRKIFASEKREFAKPEELLKNLMKNQYVKEKCKSIRMV
jgi:tRNA nucleotidyltransferase (CCA-adding enzyme)